MTPERYNRLSSAINNRQPDLTVVLENVFDPHNVSAVMRTCDAVGIQEVYILNDKIAPQKKWGYRSSSTASEWLTVHQFTDIVTCFTEVKKKYEKVYSTHFTNEAKDVFDLNLTESIALVFGNETLGVSDEVLRYSDGHFVIPQVGIIKSLNISVACAITLYEAFRQKRQHGHYRASRLGAVESHSLRKKWGLDTGN
ncbi:tRNA (guanosine(18)-2'-O)-methyltransferase TrmH [soil metagenome]